MKVRIKGEILFVIVLIFAMLPQVVAHAGIPVVGHVMITDVTPRSFSVAWASSEASNPGLHVYDDANGMTPSADAVITLQPVESGNSAIGTKAEDNGVLKVMVTGLSPDSIYYFQTVTTSKSTSDVTSYPGSTPLPGVTTESLVVRAKMCREAEVPFTNDLVTLESYLPDGVTSAEGTLVVVDVEGCSYPVSGFVGDGVTLPGAYVDLNNVFGTFTHETNPLYGGEVLTVTRLMGIHGVDTEEYFLPKNRQLAEVVIPLDIHPFEGDFDGDDDVDGSDLAVFAADFGRTECHSGPVCEGDLDRDCDVDGSDLATFAADFGRTDCP